MLKRHSIVPTDRIRVTERIVRRFAAARVLELGAGDYSFQSASHQSHWVKVDFTEPCDTICDFSGERPDLPFSSNVFDLAICTQVLEHLLWPQGLLSEIRRVLAPGGHLLVSVPNSVSATYRAAWMMGRIPSCAACGNLPATIAKTVYETESGTIAGHVIDFSKPRLAELLAHSGFEPVTMSGSGLIRKHQVIPHWMVPVSWASNIICLARKS